MDQKIRKILDDLYVFDPSLKASEPSLVKAVEMLIAERPEIVMDQVFAANLKRSILADHQSSEKRSFLSIINSSFMSKINVAIATTTVCALLIIGGIYANGVRLKNGKTTFDNTVKISATSDGAFGALTNVTNTNSGMGGGNTSSNLSVAPMADNKREQSGSEIIPPYEYDTYRYVYKGEELDLSETKREVLKRLKGQQVAMDLNGLLGSLNFGLVNLGSFPGMRLQSANFIQEGGDKYNIYVNVDESNISINGGWSVYAMSSDSSAQACAKTIDCGQNPAPISLDQIPGDDALIAAANQFVAEHGIPTSVYGMPEVQNQWRIEYAAAANKSAYYLPETVTVVYPLKINDHTIFDEGGYKTGLSVSINVRDNKVTSVWDLSMQNYQSSVYDAETDVTRILKIAEKGGVYGFVDPNAAHIVDVELGTPTLEFVRMWNYSNNVNEELLIPSLVFPVVKQPTTTQPYQYLRKSVVVPLVKQILDNNNGGMPIDIRPLVAPDAPAPVMMPTTK